MTKAEATIVQMPSAPARVITLPKRKQSVPAILRTPNILKGPRGDLENFSMPRFLLSKHLQRSTGSRKYVAYWEEHYAKANNELSGRDGGFLAPEEWNREFFKVLRGGLIIKKLEAKIMTTRYRVTQIPWGGSDWSYSYPGDNLAASSVDRTFGAQTFTMRKAVGLSTISKELVDDAADLADDWLKGDAAESVAHEVDKQALFGDGNAGRPLGLVNQNNVNLLTLANDQGNGATPAYFDVTLGVVTTQQLGNNPLAKGGMGECNGILAAPRFDGTVINMLSPGGAIVWEQGLANATDQPNGARWLGVKNWVLSALVPANLTKGNSNACSYLIFGDWRYFVLMMRTDFEFQIASEPGMSAGQYQVRVKARYDAQAIFPYAFTVFSGVLA